MPKNSIIRYLETGCFYLTDMNYQMTPDERKAQLNLIVEKMKQNPAITCGILLRHREKAVIRIFLISPFTATTRQLS